MVVAKKSGESKLVHALNGSGEAGQMPPDGPLPDADIKLIARWIDEGAAIPANEIDPAGQHWSFMPPKKAAVSAGVHPIDHLMAA
ncbi:MAG: hypothetical protein ABGY75_19510 [Gemmataceae bacterium]